MTLRTDKESITLKRLLRQQFGLDAKIQTGKFYAITRGRGQNGHVLFDVDIEPTRDGRNRIFVISGLNAGGRGQGMGKGKETVEKLVRIAQKMGAVEVAVDQGVDAYWHGKLGMTRADDIGHTHTLRLRDA